MQNEDTIPYATVMRCGSRRLSDNESTPSRPLTCKWQASANAPPATHNAMRLWQADLGINPIAHSCLLQHVLDMTGKCQCTPSDAQCIAVVSSRKSSRLGRALTPSCPSIWMRQASNNAPRRHIGWCLFCDQPQ